MTTLIDTPLKSYVFGTLLRNSHMFSRLVRHILFGKAEAGPLNDLKKFTDPVQFRSFESLGHLYICVVFFCQ
jgi:hypothetical protein